MWFRFRLRAELVSSARITNHRSAKTRTKITDRKAGCSKKKGAALFGYTDLYGGYDGGQAQYVRVPFADHGPRKVPAELTDEQVLFLSDIIPTGYSGLKWANLQPGETVAVFGCGPVGLMTQKLARAMGAAKVIGVDMLPYRLETAKRTAGSLTINAKENDPVKAIRELTEGRGADVVIDAVGMEAHRTTLEKVSEVAHAQAGTIDVVEKCLSAVRDSARHEAPFVRINEAQAQRFAEHENAELGIIFELVPRSTRRFDDDIERSTFLPTGKIDEVAHASIESMAQAKVALARESLPSNGARD